MFPATFAATCWLLLTVQSPIAGGDRAALDLGEWSERESWPLLAAGDVELAAPIPHHRNRYVFSARNPRNLAEEPEKVDMIIEMRPVQFPAGRDAYFLQWASAGSADGAAALDILFLDRATLQVLFKIASRMPGAFAGAYEILRLAPDGISSVLVKDDATVSEARSDEARPQFDFASMGYLFAKMDLDANPRFRLLNVAARPTLEPKVVAVRAGDWEPYLDASGGTHRARPVELLTANGGAVVTFWVSPEPPFFLGWNYVLMRNGVQFSNLQFVGDAG